jgi:hypothetical protein
MLWDWPEFLSDIHLSGNRFASEHVPTRVSESQNLVQFCSSKFWTIARFPYNIVDKRLEFLSIEIHSPPTPLP